MLALHNTHIYLMVLMGARGLRDPHRCLRVPLCPLEPCFRLLGRDIPSLPGQLPSAAILELSEPLEGPLGALRMVAVWVGARRKTLPDGICQDFILLMPLSVG